MPLRPPFRTGTAGRLSHTGRLFDPPGRPLPDDSRPHMAAPDAHRDGRAGADRTDSGDDSTTIRLLSMTPGERGACKGTLQGRVGHPGCQILTTSFPRPRLPSGGGERAGRI